MNKLILATALLLTSSLAYAEAYTCTGYIDGEAVKTLTVNAFKASVAEEKAADRLKKQGIDVDYVACK